MVRIYEAKAIDVRGMENVRQLTWLSTYPNKKLGLTKADIKQQFDEKKIEKRLLEREKTINKGKNSRWYVAKNGKMVIGFGSGHKDKGKWSLGIYILPAYQSKGIGKRLFSKILKYIGRNSVYLEVFAYNDKAINFYRKFNFSLTGKKLSLKLVCGKIMPLLEMKRSV